MDVTPPPPVPKLYDLIVADPPWAYRDSATRGAAASHYATLGPAELAALPVPAKPHSMLLLWATGPCLEEALGLMRAWGFRFVTVLFVWLKVTQSGVPRMGMGHYSRANCEYVLLGKRGKGPFSPWVRCHGVPQLFMAPPREHSRKPEEFWEAVTALFRLETLACIELFAREQRPGWDAWGDEVGRFTPPGVAPS